MEKTPSEFAAHGEIAGVHIGEGEGDTLAEGHGLAVGIKTPA
jgi:hypothetical protein